jgi:hypothetical protein
MQLFCLLFVQSPEQTLSGIMSNVVSSIVRPLAGISFVSNLLMFLQGIHASFVIKTVLQINLMAIAREYELK